MRLVWTEQVFERMKEIEEYISQDSVDAALAMINRIVDRGGSLEKFPNAGRVVPEFESQEIRELIEGNYRIVYRVKFTCIEILTVFEGHLSFPKNEVKEDE